LVFSLMKRVLWMICLLAAGTAFAWPQSAAEHLQAGDRSFARFDDAAALVEYEQAARLDPGSYEALWKTARAYMNVGDLIPHSRKDHEEAQRTCYRTGDQYLERAIRIDPDDSWTHFLKAALLGRQVRSMGRKEQIEAAYAIKAEIDKALALDPGNDLAWHALAYWNRTLAEVGGAVRFLGSLVYGKIPKGSYEEAVRGFQKAISLNPGYCNHHIELARTYLDMKKKDLALKELEVALTCPDQTSMCSRFKNRARREIERLEGTVSGTGSSLED
jgi:Tfp pilus assembly protein PilF